MKKITIGLLAHVDAGKTTLAEALLYKSGAIRKLGRVDNRDAFFDTGKLERQRGITIFSKQAAFNYNETQYTLLDTPGHVDFSAETERTFWVLDYALLVIDAADGIGGHTMTLWSLLRRLKIPVFIFVNKMDMQGVKKDNILLQLKNKLSDNCVDFTTINYEEIALCDEKMLERYLAGDELDEKDIAKAISKRQLFPVFFGSALKLSGIEEFLEGLESYTLKQKADIAEEDKDIFKAKVYKITRDDRGERLTHLKVCEGILKSRMIIGDEKVNQIRVYSGDKFSTINEAGPGSICCVTGLDKTRAGMFIGDTNDYTTVLEPVLTYKLILPPDIDAMQFLPKLKMLEEEEPELRVEWDENFKEIHLSVMGPVLIEVLKDIISQRFGVNVSFGEGSIVYKETIKNKVEGVGHFEPLRHYAEVHLILEPGEEGSGMKYEIDCREELLDKNWQRLIYTHLCEKMHRGVLTGSLLTDVKITVVAGRAHPKHTEGGDFRQATYRAVRQGLMQAESVLLEPYYAFSLIIDRGYIGRAMSDLERMKATFSLDESGTDEAVINGEAPVFLIANYQAEVNAYSKGTGRLSLRMAGYKPCHNSIEVIERSGYEPQRDTRNPADSVFCQGGAGYTVLWNEVKDICHVECVLNDKGLMNEGQTDIMSSKQSSRTVSDEYIGTDEVDRILEETYFSNSRKDNERRKLSKRNVSNEAGRYVGVGGKTNNAEAKKRYLLVDGYNIIHAWKELDELAKTNFDSARGRLNDILCNYQAMKGMELIVVYDAYKVKGHSEEMIDYNNIRIVFTKTAQTADHYIEKFAHDNAKKYNITVATSDGMEQVIIRGEGCLLISAREFEEEIRLAEENLRNTFLDRPL